jgi:N6-adenosine-specific RNA methylase IME4
VKSLAAKDCHLFLCVTGPGLEQAFVVMREWGFRYSTVAFTWVKLKRSHNPNQLRMFPSVESEFPLWARSHHA